MFGAFNMSPPFEMSHTLSNNTTNDETATMSSMIPNGSLSPNSRKFGPRKLCKICAEEATSNHFGALSCHACAAFFRRTVAFRRTYSCRHQQKCKLVNVSPRRMCKYCRLARCLAIGMQPCEVRSNGLGGSNPHGPTINAMPPQPQDSPSNHSDQASSSSSNAQSPQLNGMQQAICEMFNVPQDTSSLTTLLNSKREVIFNRARIGLYNGNTTIPQPSSDYKQAESFCLLRAMILESAVCTAFLNSSGLSDYLSGKDQQTLLDQALTTWINMDICNLTTRNNGIDNMDRAFCINDQFVDVNLQFLEKFYGIDKSIRSSQWIAKLQKPFWQKVLDLAKLLETSKLDEYEFAALAQLTLIKIAAETSGNRPDTQINLAPYVANLMKDIQQYYSDNYSSDNATTRLGNLVLLVSEMQELRTIYNNHVLSLFLTHQNNNNNKSGGGINSPQDQSFQNNGGNPGWMPIMNQDDLLKVAASESNYSLPPGLANILATATTLPSNIPFSATAAATSYPLSNNTFPQVSKESLDYLLFSNNITSIPNNFSPSSTNNPITNLVSSIMGRATTNNAAGPTSFPQMI